MSGLLLFGTLLAQQTNPVAGDAGAIEAGRKLYVKSCAGCHGPTGEGGRGPNLATGRQVRRANDSQLFASIQKGVPGTDMPPTPVDDAGVWQLVTFVRSLSAAAFEVPVAGDEAAGRVVFTGKGECAKCHMLRGTGGWIGPDLSNIGMTRSFNQLREAVLKPSERWVEGYRAVTVHLKNGKRLDGVLRDRTSWSLAVLDARGEMHRLKMADVADYTMHVKSLMPETRDRLSSDEIRDVLRFLSRQATRAE